MKIHLHIPYQTNADESLCAVLFIQTQQSSVRQVVNLRSVSSTHWQGEADVQLTQDATLTYAYYVLKNGQLFRREWSIFPRQLALSARKTAYHLFDWWRELPTQSWLYSAVFTPNYAAGSLPTFSSNIILKVFIPGLTQGQRPMLCGQSVPLGDWNPEQALPLQYVGPNQWALSLDAATLQLPLEYKFILRNADGSFAWEEGANHLLPFPAPIASQTAVYSELTPRFTLPLARQAGVVLPVFSIRTEQDWGIGDFGSLKLLVDWAVSTGQKMIQVLPVNDTSLTGTWQDSYPYNSVSVYALHPIYTDMSALPPLNDSKEKKFQKKRQKLNALTQIDYEEVLKLKMQRLRLAYEQAGAAVLSSQPFQQFWNENAHWLPAYAMFCALRDEFGTSDWHTWPQYSKFSEAAMRHFFTEDSEQRSEAYFYFYVQFILHNQLLSAHAYARSKDVHLKGDIPIGVSPFSADTWTQPELFHLNAQAGAPPDDFSATGQNWGFPTYNWEKMAADNYEWWKQRFAHMAHYFDAYRIDHVLGFFRIWEIPLQAVQGLLGQFSPALPLTETEIREFDFDFKPAHTKPYITDAVLDQIFGDEANHVRKNYLLAQEDGTYRLQDNYDTQRKIQAAFEGKTKDKFVRLRDGLYALCANVLFVPDHRNPQLYHPRISAMASTALRALPDEQRVAYARLYNEYFFERQDQFWKKQALEKLPALTQATSMLSCAEDLGMIPHCVPEVMRQLQMLSLEIQRMPKQLGETFADTTSYPYLSVATPSTHDMSVLRGWWKENPSLTQRFWKEVLHRRGTAPADAPADACEQILRAHLQSPSMLALISWQDWTSIDELLHAQDPAEERINVPANPKHYWRYRMHTTLEVLMQQIDFNAKVKEMIESSGR